MAPLILPRQNNSLNDYLVGSLVACAILLVVFLGLWLCFIYFKTQASNKRNATALCLESRAETDSLTSRHGLISIDVPEKFIHPGSPYHSSQSTPCPSSSTDSFHAMPLSNCTPPPRPVHIRHSRASSGFSGFTVCNQYRSSRGLAWRKSRLSFVSSTSSSRARPVHQSFEPTLPDEVALQCGDYVTVLRSFDDGWCVVARDTSSSSPMSLLSAGTRMRGDNVDIGIVPAWVFAEPLDGVACTRPFRGTSLNALRFGQNPGYARDTFMFADGS